MSEINLNVELGPRYEININSVTHEPLKLSVGTGGSGGSTVFSAATLDVTVTAAETINAYRAVGYDGFLTQTTSDALSNYAGVSRVAVITGSAIKVVRTGLVSENNWNWIPNQPVFIADNGVLTQTAPTTGNPIRRIGWAISETQLNLDPYPIIGV